MPVTSIAEAMVALDKPAGETPRHPVIHGRAGTLIALAVPGAGSEVEWLGVFVGHEKVEFIGPTPPPNGPSTAAGLTGVTARLYDLFFTAAHRYLERVEEIDERLAETQRRGRQVPLSSVWSLQRETAFVRAQLGRTVVAFIACQGPLADDFPKFAASSTAVEGELERARSFSANVQQSLSDLILLRNAEESNRIAEAANALSKTSNRIAALANISNIRMLGITYIALLLGLVSAVVLIPNTAATILGVPTAAWVPGWWVDLILVVLAIIPIAIVFSRPWVRVLLRNLRESEVRLTEGISDLPELPAENPPPSP
ncbi:MAG: hypothetical protein L3K15_05745 [Thermoplasmata archaeon]|nr:hypothetical protein [Thermoplasmata archaeon]